MLPFGFPEGSMFCVRIPTFSNTSPSFNMKRKQLDSRCCILAKFSKFAWYGKEFTNKE